MDGLASSGGDVDAKALTTAYTTDIIASCGFGMEAKSFSEEENQFREMVSTFLIESATMFKVFLLLR